MSLSQKNPNASSLDRLESALGYTFKNCALLKVALTHKSIGEENNERMEFLGDALLTSIITEYLFKEFPETDEGVLSQIRSDLVSESSLSDIAEQLQLIDYFCCTHTVSLTQRRNARNPLLADVVEAILGAIYLDSGREICRERTLSLYAQKLNNIDVNASYKDVKSQLQELVQAQSGTTPVYTLIADQGKPHQKHFVVQCALPNGKNYVGEESSIKKAEKIAATKAFTELSGSICKDKE